MPQNLTLRDCIQGSPAAACTEARPEDVQIIGPREQILGQARAQAKEGVNMQADYHGLAATGAAGGDRCHRHPVCN